MSSATALVVGVKGHSTGGKVKRKGLASSPQRAGWRGALLSPAAAPAPRVGGLLGLLVAGAGEVILLAGGRGFGGGDLAVLGGRGHAAPPVLVEHEHGGAALQPRVAALARPVPVARLAQRHVAVSVVLAQS